MNNPQISLISAMDSNRLIGKDNDLPWRLPADLAFFKATTLGKPIVMGRKTFASIGKALPGRQNIIVTRNASYSEPDCEIAASLDAAIEIAGPVSEIMIIGGASLYRQTMDRANNLYLTLIHHEFSGDTWFPEINTKDWRLVLQEDFEASERNPFRYSFVKYVRE